MTVHVSSLRSFLVSAKASLQSAIINQQRVNLVIGNESADLDSITSAIILAYFRSSSSTSPPTTGLVNKHASSSQHPPLYIPLLNTPRADVKIRTELLALLPYANLEPSHLITLDDLLVEPSAGTDSSNKEELQPRLTHLLLTDHNKLHGELAEKGFRDRVVGCIDHHVDEHVIPPDTGKEPRIIEVCGSCTSLVVRFCRQTWDSLSGAASAAGRATGGQSDTGTGIDDDALRRTWDAQIAKFAMGSIVIDTHDLWDKIKTTDTDREAVDYLEAKIALAPGGKGATWDRESFHKEISDAKRDLDKLSIDEVLRKDYKQWSIDGVQLGISSVVKTMAWQVDKAGGVEEFKRAIEHFGAERKLDLHSVMTTTRSEQGDFQRELSLCAFKKDHKEKVEQFAKEAKGKLDLEPWHEVKDLDDSDIKGGELRVWWQRNTKSSRKEVAPLMKTIFGGSR